MLNNFERGLVTGLALGTPLGALGCYLIVLYLNHKKNEYLQNLRKADATEHHLQKAINALSDD